MAEETVIIRFQGDASGVEQAADAARRSVDGLEKTTKSAGGGFDALAGIAQGAFMAIGGAAVNLAASGLAKIGDFFTGAIGEATEFQSIFAQTQAVVKSTGEAAGLTADQMADMASTLSASEGMSLFSDDAILSAQNVLATFTQIKGENFGGATQAIIDMSQALGTDLQSASLQVGKALNDPIAGVGALSRAGVQFTESQKEQIKAMTETGDIAGAQAIILGELTTQFGGSALAATDTFAGRQVILAEKMANVQQTLGNALLPIIEKFVGVASTSLIPIVESAVLSFVAFSDTVDWAALAGAIGSVITAVSSFVQGDAIPDALDGIGAGFASLAAFVEPVTTAVTNLGALAMPVITALSGAIADQLASPATIGYLDNLGQVLILVADIFVSVLAIAIDGIVFQVKNLLTTLQFLWPYIQIVINGISNLVAPMQVLVIGVLTAISQALKGDLAGAFETLKTAATTFAATVGAAVTGLRDTAITAVTGMITTLSTEAQRVGAAIISGITAGINAGAKAIASAATAAAQGALDAAKRLLGIASPSKVFADQVGYQISQGMAAGIVRGIPDVTAAIGATTGASVGTANQSIQNYYLTASYQTTQSESSIGQDLRAMQLLAGGV